MGYDVKRLPLLVLSFSEFLLSCSNYGITHLPDRIYAPAFSDGGMVEVMAGVMLP